MLSLCSSMKKAACLMLFFSLCISQGYAQGSASHLTQPSISIPLGGNDGPAMEMEPPVMMSPSFILKRFRELMRQYTFRRDVSLQTINAEGEISGEYIRNSQFVLDDHGSRVERVLYHPKSTINEMKITKEDIQDLACAQLFGFEITDLSRYNLAFKGQEEIDSRTTFIIDASPKEHPDPRRMRERFFVGRIWIDALSFQIVRMHGNALPEGKQRFPTFSTSRERLAGSDTLFPVSTIADDILHFRKRSVHYKVMVRYYAYKRFASKVSIVEIEKASWLDK